MGRSRVCESPVSVIVAPALASVAEPVAIRSVVPELPTSTGSLGTAICPAVPVTVHRAGSLVSTAAPRAR